jgi:hypothetical protein
MKIKKSKHVSITLATCYNFMYNQQIKIYIFWIQKLATVVDKKFLSFTNLEGDLPTKKNSLTTLTIHQIFAYWKKQCTI